jgi:hypothetical protein
MTIENFFFGYSRQTRLLPVLVVILPAIIVGIIYAFNLSGFQPLFQSAAVICLATLFFTQVGRHSGKRKEPILWDSWGGVPSTQLLRWRHPQFSRHIKQHYHNKLQSLYPVPNPPDAAFEQQFPGEADAVYEAWCHYIRVQTRNDKKTFYLVAKENLYYGFCRNLWGMKPIAISSIIVLAIFNYGYNAYLAANFNASYYGANFWITNTVLAAFLLGWLFIITKNFVKIPAFAYAERLIEAVNHLP